MGTLGRMVWFAVTGVGAVIALVFWGLDAKGAVISGLPAMGWGGIGLIIFFIGVFGLLWGFHQSNPSRQTTIAEQGRAFANEAWIRFHLYGDERTPERLGFENVWRWYYLRNITTGIDKDTGAKQPLGTITTFFLTFDRPVKVGTLGISSPDIKLPLYEVKDFSNRSAVVVFLDSLPSGTLEMRVTQ